MAVSNWKVVLKVWLAATLAYYFLMEALFGGFFGDAIDLMIAMSLGGTVAIVFGVISAVEWVAKWALRKWRGSHELE